jgi:hypothetical protein
VPKAPAVSEIPYFAEYLQHKETFHPKHLDEKLENSGCYPAALSFGGAIWLGSAMSFHPVFTGILAFASAGIIFTVGGKVARILHRRKHGENTDARQAFKLLDRYFAIKGRKTLVKNLDPVAAQLLEAGAFYWKKIKSVLEGPVWEQSKLTEYYQAIRKEIAEASESAMEELAVLCSNCLGAPSASEKEDAKLMWESIKEFRLGDAFSRLEMLATTDTERYVHRSPNLNAVFTSARDLAERLKLLSEELDRLSGEIVQSGSVTTQHSFSGARIDALINNLQSQRDAMRELDQTDEQIQK